jgi:hypothetical protein
MLVDMPTAMPLAPFTTKFGSAAGKMTALQRPSSCPSIDSVLLDIRQHLDGDGEERLGIAHGRRIVAIHGAEVALTVY